ncbi:hypothetical protein MMPV_004686 [Pyropia vietnamensis]
MVLRGLAAHRRREAEAAASAAFDDAVGIVSGAAALGPAANNGGGDGSSGGGGGTSSNGGCGGGRGGVDPAPLAFLFGPTATLSPQQPSSPPSPLSPRVSTAAGCAKRPRGGVDAAAAVPAGFPEAKRAPLADMDLISSDDDSDGASAAFSAFSFPRPPLATATPVNAVPVASALATMGAPSKRPRLSRQGNPRALDPPGPARRSASVPWVATPPVSRSRPPRHPALAAPPRLAPAHGRDANTTPAATEWGTLDVHGRIGLSRHRRLADDDAAAGLSSGERQELLDDLQYHLDGIFPPGGTTAAPLSTSRRVAGVLGLGRLFARRSRASPGADAYFATLRSGGLLQEVVRRLLGVAEAMEPPSQGMDAAVVLVIHMVARHPDNGPLFDASVSARVLNVAGRWSPTDTMSDDATSSWSAASGVRGVGLSATASAAVPRWVRRRRLRASPSMALTRPSVQRCLLRDILVEDEAARAAAAEEHTRCQAALRATKEPADVDTYVAAMLPPPRALPHVHPRVVSCCTTNGWTVTYLALSTLALAFTHSSRALLPAGSTDALRVAWRVLAATSPALDVSGDPVQSHAMDSSHLSSTSLTSDASLGVGHAPAPASAVVQTSVPLCSAGDDIMDGHPLNAFQLRCLTAETLRIVEYLSLDDGHAQLLCRSRAVASGDTMRVALAAVAAGGRSRHKSTLLTLEPLLAAALKVLINLSNYAAERMEREGVVDAVLTLLASEAAAVDEGARHSPAALRPYAAQETYDLRVLCLTLLTSIISRCPAVGESFPSRQPPRLEVFELGGLGLLFHMVDLNGRVGGCRAGAPVSEEDISPEQRLTSGYLTLLLGSLAASGPIPCELIRQFLPAPGGLGLLADALGEFFDFQVSCGVPPDRSMEARYDEIIVMLREADTAADRACESVFPGSAVTQGSSLSSLRSL